MRSSDIEREMVITKSVSGPSQLRYSCSTVHLMCQIGFFTTESSLRENTKSVLIRVGRWPDQYIAAFSSQQPVEADTWSSHPIPIRTSEPQCPSSPRQGHGWLGSWLGSGSIVRVRFGAREGYAWYGVSLSRSHTTPYHTALDHGPWQSIHPSIHLVLGVRAWGVTAKWMRGEGGRGGGEE